MTSPTNEEIEYGFNAITRDGVKAKITTELSILSASHPLLRVGVKKRVQDALVLLQLPATFTFGLHAVISGAMIYGIHLGMHLMQFRAKSSQE